MGPTAPAPPGRDRAACLGRLAVLVGHALGHDDRRTEAHDPATEGDRAEREPGPTEGQPGHHVRQPVHTEEHAGRRHRGRQSGRRAGDERPCTRATPPADQQADRGEHGGRRGAVPGRERRAREPGELADVRTGPVNQDLDAVGEEVLTDRHRGQEGERSARRDAALLDDRRHHDDHEDPSRAADHRDVTQDSARELGGLLGAPAGRREVPSREAQVAADHQQQDAHSQAAAHDDDRRDGEGDAGEGRRIGLLLQHLGGSGMPADLLPDGRRGDAGRLDRRPSPRHQRHQSADRQSGGDHDSDHSHVAILPRPMPHVIRGVIRCLPRRQTPGKRRPCFGRTTRPPQVETGRSSTRPPGRGPTG